MPGTRLNSARHRKQAARLEADAPQLGDAVDQAVAADEVDLSNLTKSELKEMAAARDLPVSGTKAALIERLGG